MESVVERRFSFLTPPAPVAEPEITETVDVDIVVAGAGLSGLVAALRASELGASVAVLEKTKSWSVRGERLQRRQLPSLAGSGRRERQEEFVREVIPAAAALGKKSCRNHSEKRWIGF